MTVVALSLFAADIPVRAHIFIPVGTRSGTAPCAPGSGWLVECYYDIPDPDAANLLLAELYAGANAPTFTFLADQLAWPAGPVSGLADADLSGGVLGDFLDGHISGVSDPNAMNLPFDKHFLLKATAHINVREFDSKFAPPLFEGQVWLEHGLVAFDGGRVRVGGTTVFRILTPVPVTGFGTEQSILSEPGTYPIEVTYLQRFDPADTNGMADCGIELTGCYDDGEVLPSGGGLLCDGSPGTSVPTHIIYQPGQIITDIWGDYLQDSDVDLRDFARMQICAGLAAPEEDFETFRCQRLDPNANVFFDATDWSTIEPAATGPCTP